MINVKRVVREIINEYLDKDAMMPLKKYLDNTPQRYKGTDINKLWHVRQTTSADVPTSRHAFSKHELFKNNWVLHFTPHPFEIIKNGFKGISVQRKDDLWRTFGQHMPRDYGNGYAFAYDVNDVPKNAIDYGKYALMFRTSGLKVYNRGDLGEWQVIFNPQQVNLRDCFILKCGVDVERNHDGNGDMYATKHLNSVSVIHPLTKKTVYKGETLEDATTWVKENYNQYNKFLNGDKYKQTFKKQDQELEKRALEIINHIKSTVQGNVLVIPFERKGVVWLTIIYDKPFKFYSFVDKLNLRPSDGEGSGVFTDGRLFITKYRDTHLPQILEDWKKKYPLPKNLDDLQGIQLWYRKNTE